MACSNVQTVDHTTCRNQQSCKTHGVFPLYFEPVQVCFLVGLPTGFWGGGEDVDLPQKYEKYVLKLKQF